MKKGHWMIPIKKLRKSSLIVHFGEPPCDLILRVSRFREAAQKLIISGLSIISLPMMSICAAVH